MTTDRRLLDGRAVSVKLGQPHDWFEYYRASLDAAGFPAPCLSADQFGEALWDARAIDLWLDARMDPNLRTLAASITNHKQSADWDAKLSGRAREISI